MSINNTWLLPEGIEEILPPKAMEIEQLCREMIDLLSCWGYELVIPPLVEYVESLLLGSGEDLHLKTYKLIDQLNGRLMGLRADITSQVARIDSYQLKRNLPTRLSYLGSVLHTRPSKSGGTRAPLQLGAELFGCKSIAADIEIVQLMLATLQRAGIKKPYLDLSHVGIFQALVADANLNAMQQRQVFLALQAKAKDKLTALYKDWKINDKASQILLALMDLNGGIETLVEAKKLFKGLSPNIKSCMDELTTLAKQITKESNAIINIDLAELRSYHYHTGMIYTVFVPGAGEGVAFGGRYNSRNNATNQPRPATGFSTDVKSLLKFQKKQTQPVSKIYAPKAKDIKLQKKITQLRAAGKIVIQALLPRHETATAMGCDKRLVLENGRWVVKKVV